MNYKIPAITFLVMISSINCGAVSNLTKAMLLGSGAVIMNSLPAISAKYNRQMVDHV